MTRFWLDDVEPHPARERMGCMEAIGLIVLIVVGWLAALWIDSVLREAQALKRPAAEGQR